MIPPTASDPKAGRTRVTRSESFRSPNCRRLFDHWRHVRGDRPRPAWTDIDLMELRDIAPFMLVRDAVDGGWDFGVRFFGSQLVETLQHDLTGKLLSARYDPESFEILRERFAAGLNADGPIRVVGFIDLVETRSQKVFEQINLPLSESGGTPSHIISVYDFGYELQADDLDPDLPSEVWTHLPFPRE